MTAIYLLDDVGVLAGPVDLPVVPGLGRQLPGNAIELDDVLHDLDPGQVWALVDGQPRQLADHRGTVYSTDTGEAVEHRELGALPEGLTPFARPGPFHSWFGGGWVLDDAAKIAAEQAEERAWRDGALPVPCAARDRHRDELELGIGTTLTAEQFAELLAYIQQLRDWPQSELFPAVEHRPVPPYWYR